MGMEKSSRPVVLLLFGGQSSEHEISCATAAGVMEAIDQDRWEVIPVGISPSGQWVREPLDPARLRLGEGHGYRVSSTGTQVAFLPGSQSGGKPRLVEFSVDSQNEPVPETMRMGPTVDVVFPLLHGPYGEDGTVQGTLEIAPVRYVGCGVTASAVSMDKRLTKMVLAQAGIPTGSWQAVSALDWETDPRAVLGRLVQLPLPVFVKPCRAGSSMGISRVVDPHSLSEAIEVARKHDPQLIVEATNVGRELECGVLQLPGGKLVASPLGEVAVDGAEFYDYESKYFSTGGTTLTCPAPLTPEAELELQNAAKRAFVALGCEGLARVDFFYNEAESTYVINEVNTMPGFTPFSMYPVMLNQAGYDYPLLVQTLLEQALSRPAGLR